MPLALSVPLSRFAPRAGGGSVFQVRPLRTWQNPKKREQRKSKIPFVIFFITIGTRLEFLVQRPKTSNIEMAPSLIPIKAGFITPFFIQLPSISGDGMIL